MIPQILPYQLGPGLGLWLPSEVSFFVPLNFLKSVSTWRPQHKINDCSYRDRDPFTSLQEKHFIVRILLN